MKTSTANHEIDKPAPIETPRQLLDALAAFRNRWVGKRVSPTTRDEMFAEYDDIRARSTPTAFLALELQDLVSGVTATRDPKEADGLWLITLSGGDAAEKS